MTNYAINLTEFQVRALKCIGGDCGATPHHLTTRSGAMLGEMGSVMQPAGKMPVVSAMPRPRKPVRRAVVLKFFRKG